MNNIQVVRGKALRTRDWVYGVLFRIGSDFVVNGDEVDPATLGRDTGVLDVEGVGVFEGDEVGVWHPSVVGAQSMMRLVVDYHRGAFGVFTPDRVFHPLCQLYTVVDRKYVSGLGSVVSEDDPCFMVLGNVFSGDGELCAGDCGGACACRGGVDDEE